MVTHFSPHEGILLHWRNFLQENYMKWNTLLSKYSVFLRQCLLTIWMSNASIHKLLTPTNNSVGGLNYFTTFFSETFDSFQDSRIGCFFKATCAKFIIWDILVKFKLMYVLTIIYEIELKYLPLFNVFCHLSIKG